MTSFILDTSSTLVRVDTGSREESVLKGNPLHTVETRKRAE